MNSMFLKRNCFRIRASRCVQSRAKAVHCQHSSRCGTLLIIGRDYTPYWKYFRQRYFIYDYGLDLCLYLIIFHLFLSQKIRHQITETDGQTAGVQSLILETLCHVNDEDPGFGNWLVEHTGLFFPLTILGNYMRWHRWFMKNLAIVTS